MSMWSMLIIDTLVVFDAMNPNEVQVGFLRRLLWDLILEFLLYGKLFEKSVTFWRQLVD